MHSILALFTAASPRPVDFKLRVVQIGGFELQIEFLRTENTPPDVPVLSYPFLFK
jgi:hypothetical protein